MKTIFLTNDDGIQALGLRTLAHLMSRLGRVVVVAPDSARSGAACSITPTTPILLNEWHDYDKGDADPLLPARGGHPIAYYTCSGTPVDCVKLASETVLDAAPDLMVSGINHGDNASVSAHYSGTVGAVVEATLKGWPSVAFSLRTFQRRPDFSPFFDAIVRIAAHVLAQGLPSFECLNVNFPEVESLRGIRVGRMARGIWSGEWEDAHNPHGKRAFWLTGRFTSLEPEQEDTDYWALDHGYAAVTPLHLDMTAHGSLEMLRKLFHDNP